jgi:ribosomal-protein-alanine N-acetyltransferase
VIELRQITHDEARAVLAGEVPFAHVPDWPHADTFDALRPLAEHPGFTGPGTFLVVADGQVVGDCGWFGPPDADGEVEIGYGLAPSVRGRGLGRQAVQALLAWVRAQGAMRVRAEVLPGNEASLRLLRGVGFEVIGERAGHLVLLG